ncbi:YxlC family protein [Bacillus pumilus]|uniref:YxlC family protein n=1 Tax=Bacillus pumilus TaxID=1408 RepID=UPI001D027D32|nr:YxlC family protein [Bacillus pumilus]MCP1528151.1 NADH:ubiquinone oxidoreductase subunit 2 (subunit N) [Bacillus pumilus]MDF9783523.1 NADH:ubiquinone oxidoreductase subunit 2 (subunit N) [Bacillus pumilus]UDF16460.1 YxlC family protein [Bacillus pumilus]
MKEDQFTERLKEELQQLDDQIEVKEPSEQAVMMMLKQAKEQEKRRFKQEVLAYVLISLTILTLFVAAITHLPIIFILLQVVSVPLCVIVGIKEYQHIKGGSSL